MNAHIYLDHAATSPLLPDVLEAMMPWLKASANPSSAHAPGRLAAAAVEDAREQVASLIGRPAQGIVFVSGATEGNHTAIRGFAALGAKRFAHSRIEHPSVLGALAAVGAEEVPLAVRADGVVVLSWEQPIDAVVLQAVNHELGTIQPVAEASRQARARGLLLHVDATQAAGRIPMEGDPDSLVLSSHKLGGPMGIGALSLRSGDLFPAWLTGGSQERRRRAGTVNVAGAVGFGLACALAKREQEQRMATHRSLADQLQRGLAALGAEIVVSGSREAVLPSITTFICPGIRGDLLVAALDLRGIAVSSGAACASGSMGPSPVLAALGHREPAGGVRVSFGPHSHPGEVDILLATLAEVQRVIREAERFEL